MRNLQRSNTTVRGVVAVVVTIALAMTMTALAGVTRASADTAPVPPETRTTVSSDALPTVQIDGVVWAQRVVGNIVYVGGKFTTARPAGAAPGVNTTPRSNFLAYDIRTGELIPSVVADMNAQVLNIAASPDGTRVYVVGDFTTVNGVKHERIVALDGATGAVINSWKGGAWSRIGAVAATNDTVYAGGNFTMAGSGIARGSLAAFSAANGTVLGWAPSVGQADGGVTAMTMNPSRSKVIIGGHFATVNGTAARGMAALDPVTGTVYPWQANTVIKNSGPDSGITSLTADDTYVYGTGYTYGPGNLEGTFKADAETGQIKWLEDCHGDTYSTFPMNDEVYSVGHAHYCENIGGFPQTDPQASWTFHRALAFSKEATGTITKDHKDYYNWEGMPSPSPLYWYPELQAGDYTGITQAAWSVSGNSQYLVLGGEFPKVGDVKQQGLVRFAVTSTAPNKTGPEQKWANFVPTLSELPGGGIRGTFNGNWDSDNETLTYKVMKEGNPTPLRQQTLKSTVWRKPTITFIDPTAQAGQTYNYRLQATDPWGNTSTGNWTAITATKNGAAVPAYVNAVLASNPRLYWRLGEPSGSFLDWAGVSDGVRGGGVTAARAGALGNDPDTASSFDGTANGRVSAPTATLGLDEFSVEAWVRTTSTTGGRIIGFGNTQSGTSSSYDRRLYMTDDGKLIFGVHGRSSAVAASSAGYNDGQWHQVVGTMSPATGMKLFVDGAQVADNPDGTFALGYTGYWRLGGDSLGGWPSAPTSTSFKGEIDEAAVYSAPLTGSDVVNHWLASDRDHANRPPFAAFGVGRNGLSVMFDGSRSSDSDGTITSYAWDYGDGSTGSGVMAAAHLYAAPGTYNVTLTVTDDTGASTSTTQSVAVSAVVGPNVDPTAAFTATTHRLQVTFDGSSSVDRDGIITAYAWNFGDGSTGAGKNPPVHTYARAGTYNATLSVTDNRGATKSKTLPVTLAANVAPTARFSVTNAAAGFRFDASGSTDPDGTIAAYSWDFGDGTTATGRTPRVHHFPARGQYRVTLRLTDNEGLTGTRTTTVNDQQARASGQKTAQSIRRVPAKVKVGKTRALPRRTVERMGLVWKVKTPKVCKLTSKSHKIKGKKVGTCVIKASAPGDATHKAFRAKLHIRVKR